MPLEQQTRELIPSCIHFHFMFTEDLLLSHQQSSGEESPLGVDPHFLLLGLSLVLRASSPEADAESSPTTNDPEALGLVLLLQKSASHSAPSQAYDQLPLLLLLLFTELERLQAHVEYPPTTNGTQLVRLIMSLEHLSSQLGPLSADDQLSLPPVLIDFVLVSFQGEVEFEPVACRPEAGHLLVLLEGFDRKHAPLHVYPELPLLLTRSLRAVDELAPSA